MGYGDVSRHLLDQEFTPWDATQACRSSAPAQVVVGTPAQDDRTTWYKTDWAEASRGASHHDYHDYHDYRVYPDHHGYMSQPSAPDAPRPQPWVSRPDLQPNMAMPPAPMAPPHQARMATALAREHGHDFKVALHQLYVRREANVRGVCEMLGKGCTPWQRLGLGKLTVGIVLKLTPERIVITPDGFFTAAKPAVGTLPGQLAPLCSADFVTLGTPVDFMHQVHAELNSLLRRRNDIWRELMLFYRPKKNLHTCRTMPH